MSHRTLLPIKSLQDELGTDNLTKEEAERFALAQLLDFILPNWETVTDIDVLFKGKTVTRVSRATLDHRLTRISWTQHAIFKKKTTLVNFLYQSVFSFIHRSLFLYSLKQNEVKLPRWTFLIVENVTGCMCHEKFSQTMNRVEKVRNPSKEK